MSANTRKLGKVSLAAAMLIASATFCFVGLMAPRQPGVVAGTPGGPSGSPVTSVDIQMSATPNPATVGQKVTVSASVAIVGGPSQATFTITVSVPGSESYTATFQTVLDENGLWGFALPPIEAEDEGEVTITVAVEAGGAKDTETLTFTINPATP